MVADVSHEITKAYGVEHPASVALRASFLIDKDGNVVYIYASDKDTQHTYIAAAEKAGVDPVIAASMKEMEKHNKIMAKLLKQNK